MGRQSEICFIFQLGTMKNDHIFFFFRIQLPPEKYEGLCMLSCFSCLPLFVTLWIVDCQAPLSMGFSRQECWSGLPFPPPGDLSDPGIKPTSCLLYWQADSLPRSHQEALCPTQEVSSSGDGVWSRWHSISNRTYGHSD